VTNGLRSASGNLNHLGLQQAPSKSSLSYQNQHRECKVFEDYYYLLLKKLSTMARFQKRKGAIKLHTLLDYDGCFSHDGWKGS